MRGNPVLVVFSGLLLAALALLPLVRVAPNRLVSGAPVQWWTLLHGPQWAWAVLPLGLLLAGFLRPRRALLWAVVAAALALALGLLWQASALATALAQREALTSPLALGRTALGGGFWLAQLLLGLVLADALQRLGAGLRVRLAVLGGGLLVLLAMLLAGGCDELSVVKEYLNRSDVLGAAVLRHVQIVLLTLALTLCLGLPLGWAVHRSAALRRSVFPVLNIIQTVPSIALFGLLMAPLALLAATYPGLARAGISGIGLAPGVIALTLYSLLPIVRGLLAGLEQVPRSVLEAARGMGMAPWQRLWHIEVPLALPLLLAGVRTASVQAVGLAAVTALIGAGGLGAIMFEGLFSSAQDVVLLGVGPIIALAVLADAGFKLLIQCLPAIPPT